MGQAESVTERVQGLLDRERVGVLATHCAGEPYASLVGFVPEAGVGRLLFATGRSTRKFANLGADPRASLLVDDRTHRDTDFSRASAATAVGVVVEVEPSERESCLRLYLDRFPFLEEFVVAPTSALLRLTVHRWVVVTRFQQVMELHLAP